jgi:hypothetical protein
LVTSIMCLVAMVIGLIIAIPIAIALGTIVGSARLIREERRIRSIVADSKSDPAWRSPRRTTHRDTDQRFH